MSQDVSIIIPAKNEFASLCLLLPALRKNHPGAEIIVVSDGSTDDTEKVCVTHNVVLLKHPYSMGNGAAVKSGARAAHGKILVFMDADGQHNPEDIPRLLSKLQEGYDMVVGARHSNSQASLGRSYANKIYNWLASWMVGQKIDDLTSGFRAVHADKFRQFLYLLPNGFSYPTTITMSFFRAGFTVTYVPIFAGRREGKSHVRIVHDGVRFLLIIFKVGTLYAPLKFFFPISLGFFFTGLFYYLYTFISYRHFTNMSALLFITSVLVFLIGLVSEQITVLNYKDSEK
ncbi:MAG: glycosyltransferase family 2 protein [Sulfuricaulis sp.]|uniref:glycosyltransferase family 2 protein n=1 Tax=Sulfuricaulis sp. TaxID=2003553 RepID=UPI003C526E65